MASDSTDRLGCAGAASPSSDADGVAAGKDSPQPNVSGADFVWRFRIDEKPSNPLLEHPLDELLRVQWEELLKLCVPMFQGNPVKIDGFATMRDSKKILPIFPDTVRNPHKGGAISDS